MTLNIKHYDNNMMICLYLCIRVGQQFCIIGKD